MSITLSPSKAAYLVRVAEGLADLPSEDRDEVIQDLESHLAELEDGEVEATLGDPDEFVSEFRSSAGLNTGQVVARPTLIERGREALNRTSTRLAEITQWQSLRPTWVWVRGWLVVSAWSVLYDFEGFSRFPIPTIGQSTLTGLVLVVGATWLSLWLDRGAATRHPVRSVGSVTFSVVAAFALIGTLANPMPTQSELVRIHAEQIHFDGLTATDGELVENIYAYDIEGNPVEVLLFDQAGRPLLSLPDYVYEDAEYLGGGGRYGYSNGAVTFATDRFGRIIPNLYPLELFRYDEYGSLRPMTPPSLGFPAPEEDRAHGVPTTIAELPAD